MWEKEKAGRFGLECYYTVRQRLEQNPYRSGSKPYVLFGSWLSASSGGFGCSSTLKISPMYARQNGILSSGLPVELMVAGPLRPGPRSMVACSTAGFA